MPRPNALGRPNTQVIPASWETSHAAVAAKTMTATGNLRRPGSTDDWSDANERDEFTPHAPYATDVAARVQALTSAALRAEIDAADETVHTSGYLVTIPRNTAVDVEDGILTGDLFTVTASSDPLLTGRTLRVTEVTTGSVRWERDLFCTLND